MSIQFTDNITAIDAVSANKTTDGYDFSKRQLITAVLKAAGITSGNGVFSFDVSNDGVNWVTGIAVKNAVTTTSTTLVTSITLSSNTAVGVVLPAGFRFYRAVVAFTTDGVYSCVFEALG